ncbi:MAG: hypothetical protein ACP5OO_10095 [Chloroflexia bacterium]
MENVYLAAIAGIVAIVVVVFALLHRRIVHARGKISLKERVEMEAEVKAVPPEPERTPRKPKPYSSTPSGIRAIVQIGSPIIRVLRGIRVFRILQIGRGRIEVVESKTTGDTERTDDSHPHRPQA